ncbi:hypothetical protein PR003_g9013 [Phytophthora rubi]|uniref:Uncharacterized protein n=1 Tax=Phytophthora rubi TaxID=129364 RepID=A0A6A4FFI1_9STRA|nr:hypothetical protein PR003_g9013 [Phytophthora rubi]
MSLSAFVPTNTQKVRTTAISAFKRMLELEDVSLEFIQASILMDAPGKRLAATMDRFGYYLATNEGKNGKLARNTASSYYRNVKLWLFDEYPHLCVATELILLKQGKILDKHCQKRENGGLTNKAPPCTKEDLKALVRYVYSTARVNVDYQAAALACLMWHCFGRSSDLAYAQKQHVSVSADGVFYLRLLRVKTAEEQGLTLVPDRDDFLTCPLHALAVALVAQEAPCASLIGNLPCLVPQDAAPLDAGAPLHDFPAGDPGLLQVSVVQTTTPVLAADDNLDAPPVTTYKSASHIDTNISTEEAAGPRGVTAELTSHSFRRGGAQHANGYDHLAAQWIFDRGAWDMTKTNKAFAYITNTAREDRKVARVLSGWKADASPTVVDVDAQDHTTRERLGRLQGLLFSTCTGLKEQRLNVSTKVLSVLTGYLVRYYPQLTALAPDAPVVTRVEECMQVADISTADLLAWSMAMNDAAAVPAEDQDETQKTTRCREHDHLLAVIEELIAFNRATAARLTIVEAALVKAKGIQVETEAEHEQETSNQEPKPKRRKKSITHLSGAWFEWYTRVPRVWDCSDRQKKSEFRHVVAFMKLFIADGFILNDKSSSYKDQVLAVGTRAEEAVLQFLKAQGINPKGAGGVLRALRPLHKSGVLDERIAAYKHLLSIGRIQDPAPTDTQDILAFAGPV